MHTLLKLPLFLFLLFVQQYAFADSMRYSKAKIWFDGRHVNELARTGIDLSEGEYQYDKYFISDFSEKEIEVVRNAGFRIEILVEDVASFYRNRNLNLPRTAVQPSCGLSVPEYPVPSYFHLGSMGGYFTYQEMLDILDSMALLFPNLVTAKSPIDTTLSIEGRPIYYVKISDNPQTDEQEPEVLYDAVHHAREPGSMSALIYYMWYLLENYSTDTTLRALVDHTEMYFIPCVNPDGYLYNQQTNPQGGGMWRKNRRDNLDGEFGVDINRNYGHQWGYDTLGSSMNTFSQTFRGTAPFSEPETQAMRNFLNSRHFNFALNYHTFGEHHIIPWGYVDNLLTPDSMQFEAFGKAITRFNNYNVGTTNQTLFYLVNGSADDWMYGEQVTKNKVFSMTPEVGSNTDGFWPPYYRIIPLCQEQVYANLTLAKLAGRYGILKHNASRYVSQHSNFLSFDFTQLGLDTTGLCTVSLQPLTSNIVSTGSPVAFSQLSVLQTRTDSISFSLAPSISQGEEFRYVIVANNGMYNYSDTISQIFGTPLLVFNDLASTISNWNAFPSSSWGITDEDYVSQLYSITDSPFNLYQPVSNDPLTLNTPIDLSGLMNAKLTFYTKWNLEPQFDYVQVLASPDNGTTWTALCGKYTVPGAITQVAGEPLYDGNQFDWVKEEMDLSDFLGQQILIRFVLISDQGQELDGFYFDDMSVWGIPINTDVAGLYDSPKASLNAFPNPAADYTSVNFQNIPEGSLFVIKNMLGKPEFQIPILEVSGNINPPIRSFANGLYICEIKSKDGQSITSLKLVISK